MSSTLTWAHSGLATKTGTGIANFLDDLDTLVTSKAGDASFSWQVASKNSAGADPKYLVLKRKDASAGRILFVYWASTPGTSNGAIFVGGSPTGGTVYCTWFPAGNTDTPLNLASASGTILGDDTNVLRVGGQKNIATIYQTNYQVFYEDSAEGVFFGTGNPGSSTTHGWGVGKLVVDQNDDAYDCMLDYSTQSMAGFGAQASTLCPWTIASTAQAPGSASPHMRINYGSANKIYYHAYIPSGPWGTQSAGSNDLLTDTSVNKAWFVPQQLLSTDVKGQGLALKLRQIAMGPATTGAFQTYNTTGPVVKARQFCQTTGGGAGYPWFTNFKV